jgi:hypothetical protein
VGDVSIHIVVFQDPLEVNFLVLQAPLEVNFLVYCDLKQTHNRDNDEGAVLTWSIKQAQKRVVPFCVVLFLP